MNAVQLYHLYARRTNGGRVRLTVWPMPKSACEVMASKQSDRTRPDVYILPARWDDVTIPDDEK